VVVDGYEDALRILLNNLVDNAIRYTPEGGRVTVRLGGGSGEAAIEITDTGPGIANEDRERVFDRFYRGRNAGAEGSGLGLAIVARIVEMHRGSIRMEPAEGGRGLSVHVLLPATARPTEAR
jgi:signal transduction histidine kinase